LTYKCGRESRTERKGGRECRTERKGGREGGREGGALFNERIAERTYEYWWHWIASFNISALHVINRCVDLIDSPKWETKWDQEFQSRRLLGSVVEDNQGL
jgi:hypothetical protein